MDHDLIRAALLALGGVTFYAILARGLFNITEPSRQKTLDLAQHLFHSAQVTDKRKAAIGRRLDEVYSNRQAWKLAFYMLYIVFRLPFHSNEVTSHGVPRHLQKEFNRFTLNWMIATVGNSPAAMLIFATFLLIALAFSVSMSAVSACLAGDDNHHSGARGAKAT